MENNPQIELARRYVEQTGVSVFLTGKAGTGKTTFLHEVVRTTTKRHAVVAPTGVAAINAGGVTIHSFFQLPFDPYLPDIKELVTEYQMPNRYKSLSKNKLNIIRTLELLIIDEVSMVRADLLDAIDMTLRRVRRSSRPFGGVQLLMIGDVHQLSPVVTERERPYMEQVYPSPYFFASKALQHMPYTTIELSTVYRQQDATFVELLNRVRNGHIDTDVLHVLNSRLTAPDAIPTDRAGNPPITLTTHNRQADSINDRQLSALHGKSRTFEAKTTGSFPEKSIPCDKSLVIKVGERVMFLKNDTSGGHRYYNGKLGTVTGFSSDDNKDYIEVIDDDGDTINVGREVWESMRYTIDPTSNDIVQEVEGTFSQYPLQAAWAVTIHKAQGLTFDRVAIDAADAFAFGQVYVALSRCRTLDGLYLTTPLSADVAFDDASVSHFVSTQPTFEQAASDAAQYQQQYRMEKLMELFSVDALLHHTERLYGHYSKLRRLYPDKVNRMQRMLDTIIDLQGVSERFKAQLMHLDEEHQDIRAGQGAKYYHTQLKDFSQALVALLDVDVDNKETAKAIREAGDEVTDETGLKLACLDAVARKGYSVACVQHAKASYVVGDSGSNRQKKKVKKTVANETSNDTDLIAVLRRWRTAKAKEADVAAFRILHQEALMTIAAAKPRTIAELERLNGIGPKTVNRYGDELLALVADFIENEQGL